MGNLSFDEAKEIWNRIIKSDDDKPYNFKLDLQEQLINLFTSEDKYIRLLQQVTPIQADSQGSIFRTFGVHTDITYIKPEGRPVLNIIGLNGEPSYYDVQPNPVFEPTKPLVTKREQEILKLVVEGKTSVEIAQILCISTETVKTHRRNILSKSGAKNAMELIALSVDRGWL